MYVTPLMRFCLSFFFALVCLATARADLKILFLGDNGHHKPRVRFGQIEPVLKARGIHATYTDAVTDLNAKTLKKYNGVLLYANIDRIAPAQAKALLDYVNGGGGFIPLHCASYCFRNSKEVVALMGAQFKRHGWGKFATEIANSDHPIMRRFGGFESWDETYEHHLHNEKNRTILSYRTYAGGKEPWTWVRTHGKGRVFYTAWGHDQRTWGHPGFQNLLERGIRWACGEDPGVVASFVENSRFIVPKMTALRKDVKPFEYVDVGPKIPNYTPGQRWGVQGNAYRMMQKPVPATESVKHFVTPVNFQMKPFADETLLGGNAIAMNWDERGRLWICQTQDYPNELKPPGQGRDRIRILEDSDDDGKADKCTTFADKLSIPTAMIFYRGGVIVQDGRQTLYLKDTNGDDKADFRKVLISGWQLGDTHGGVGNFHYGLDNWIWAMQGYNFSRPTYNGKRHQGFRMGFFRFKLDNNDPPNVTNVEFIRSTDNNTWGLGFSEEGIVFGSTANRNPSVYMPIANRYYERVRGWAPKQLRTIADTHLFKPITKKIRQVDHHNGYTAGAGHALYTARAYPPTWWNRTAFVCGPTGHLVGTFVLNREGADFRSTSPCNLVASDDEWCAPIMAEVGPDGNVWIADWYNYIVQHNPTPRGFRTGKGNAYVSDLRDKKHGRIYRLVYKGKSQANSATPEMLSKDNPQQLVAALTHPTMLWRKQAQRLLVERGKADVVPQLIDLLKDKSVDAIGLNVGAIHALWALHGLGALDGKNDAALAAGQAALKHPSAGVRRNAALVLPPRAESVAAILKSGVVNDSDAQVKLAALLALADMPPHPEAGAKLAGLSGSPQYLGDRWLRDALTSASAMHALPFLQNLTGKAEPSADQLKMAAIVAEHIARGEPSGKEVEGLVTAMKTVDPKIAEAILGGLAKGWPAGHRVTLTKKSAEALAPLLERLPPGGKGQLLRLASLWGSKQLEQHATKIVRTFLSSLANTKLRDNERIAAARRIVGFQPGSNAVVAKVLDQITPQASPALTKGLLEALGDCTADKLGSMLVARAATMTPAARKVALNVLLSRPITTVAFLDGVEGGKLELLDLRLEQKAALSEHPDRSIRRRVQKLLRAGGGLPDPNRVKVVEELLPLMKKTGDVKLGKLVFTKNCANCHTHGGEGKQIGPDLTGMAVHPKEELLVHIMDPSRSVEGNFRTYTVLTKAGRVFTGMLAGESSTTLEIIDSEAKNHTVQRADIDELIASKKSVMPEGFEKQIKSEELVNLLEFLTNKGRFVPISLMKAATAISTKGLFHTGDNGPDRMIFEDWKPKVFADVPFVLVDPKGKTTRNIILLNGPQGSLPPKMPKSVRLPCNTDAEKIHLLSGVSGWGYPYHQAKTVTMIVRLHYEDGKTEDHPLRNGVHFADYIRRVDVPGSKYAFRLRGQQIRHLAVVPKRNAPIREIELISGDDPTAPMVMAVTVERGMKGE